MLKRLILALTTVFLLAAPAQADLLAKAGHFGIGTGAATTTVSVTGVGFQPKLVIFMWNGRINSTDFVGDVSPRFGYGVYAGSGGQWAAASLTVDNSATGNAGSGLRTDSCVAVSFSASGFDGWAQCTSLDSDGFTLTISDAFASDWRIGYIALGGSDVANVKTGVAMTGTTTGDIPFTGVGFQPDAMLFAGFTQRTTTTDGLSTELGMGLGFASGSGATAQAVCAQMSDHGTTTPNTGKYCRTGEVLAMISTATGINNRASLTSFDSDGFTLNFTTTTSSRAFLWLAIEGTAQFFVGDTLTRTDGNDIVESGFGFQPAAVIAISHGASANTAGSPNAGSHFSLGFGTSATERLSMAYGDEDKGSTVTNTDTTAALELDEIYINITPGSPDTLAGLMDIKSVDADGYTFVMDDTDPSAAWVAFFAIGPAAGGGGGGGNPPSGPALRGAGK